MWRYEVVKVSPFGFGEELKFMLNDLGRHDWKLVAIHHDHLIFIRPGEPKRHTPTHAVLTIQGGTMAGQLTVDQDGNAIVGFMDDHGNATGLPSGDGSGLVATFAGDDGGALITIGAAAVGADPAGNATEQAQIVPVGPTGQVNVSVTLTNSSGAPLNENDGVTPFPAIASFLLTLVAGPAAEGELSVDAA